MQSRILEIFYLFFQGILTFQVLLFSVLYFITRRKDFLYYCLFLFFAATYFFINAPYTFFGIPEENVWDSIWYDYINTPVIIIENFFYLLFIQAFFEDITNNKKVKIILNVTLWLIPIITMLFIILTALRINKQFIFYTVKIIAILPALLVAHVILKTKPLFARLVANGLLCTVAGTLITVLMIILSNAGVHHIFTEGYPLFFVRIGILGDIIFYLLAILKKWHFQEKQLTLEKLTSDLAVEKLRNKISRELHDDFGSTLSEISMYSYMVSQQMHSGKHEAAKHSLSIISKSALEMVNRLRELVWVINPEKDSLGKLMERLEEYATDMAAIKNMKVKITFPDKIADINLQIENRRNIYLFCKEAINNAVKYSNGSLLELSIKEGDNKLDITVSDNGKGFDALLVRRGNGLHNMQKRADEIGAKLILQSKENEGVILSLQFKIT